MSGYNNGTKDPLISTRSTMRAKDLKDRDILEVKIGGRGERDQGQVEALINALIAIKDNPNGVKLKFYTQKKEYNGRQFDSTFFFVAPVQDAPAGGFAPRPAVAPGQRVEVKPKTYAAPSTATTAAAAAASLKKSVV